MAKEEDEFDVIFNVQHSYNTRSKGQTYQEIPPSTSTPNVGKLVTAKQKVIPEIEYNLVDDFKKAKANISLFELLKIPSMRENIPKSMILNKSREVHNNNLEICAKPDSQNPSMKMTPPFLLIFEIFNSNIHNCMIDSGSSSNVMPLFVYKKLSATWEPFLLSQ